MPLNCESVFWSDSMSVLRYVKNESTRFHTFVANRVAVLQEGSSPDQWRYVEGVANPGDCASTAFRGTQRGYSSKPLNIALLNVF